MNTNKTIICFITVLFLFVNLSAQNSNPVVTNVRFNEFINPDGTVDIYYDVFDAEQNNVTIRLQVSNDNGDNFTFQAANLTGDVGANVTIGNNKHIIWNVHTEHPTMWGVNTFKMRVVANDETYGGSPCPGIDSLVYAGLTYHTVQIGEQCWLKENLNVGQMRQHTSALNNNGIFEKYCYSNLESNCAKYGGLYSWAEALNYQNGVTNSAPPITPFVGNIQGICPAEWHIPSVDEYNYLSSLERRNHTLIDTNQAGYTTNSSGLALKFGGELRGATFFRIGTEACIWTSSGETGFGNGYAYNFRMNQQTQISFGFTFAILARSEGKSIRCIKD